MTRYPPSRACMKSTRRLILVAVCSTLLGLLTSCSTYLTRSIDKPWQPDASLGVNTLFMGTRADLNFFSHVPKDDDYPAFLSLLPYVFIDLPISLVADALLIPGWTYDELVRHRLHKAAARGDLEHVRYLLDRGANVNAPGVWGHTPLMMASWTGRSQVVAYLISHGANPNLFVQGGREVTSEKHKATAYDFALHQRHCDIAHFLWERMDRRTMPSERPPQACPNTYHARQTPEEPEE